MAEQMYRVGHNWRRELEDTQMRLRFAHHIIENQTDRIAELEVSLAKEEWTVTWSPLLGLLFGFSFTAMTIGNVVGGLLLALATIVALGGIAYRRRLFGKRGRA